jgi:hypothetical protein
MPSVRKRLEMLERSLPPRPSQAVDRVIVGPALHSLSTEEPMSLRRAAADKRQGKVRKLTEHELAALASYGSAPDRECQRAGFCTISEFERSGPLELNLKTRIERLEQRAGIGVPKTNQQSGLSVGVTPWVNATYYFLSPCQIHFWSR